VAGKETGFSNHIASRWCHGALFSSRSRKGLVILRGGSSLMRAAKVLGQYCRNNTNNSAVAPKPTRHSFFTEGVKGTSNSHRKPCLNQPNVRLFHFCRAITNLICSSDISITFFPIGQSRQGYQTTPVRPAFEKQPSESFELGNFCPSV
jgi:hypothetical protein